ncbi:hypothetical protein ADK75_14860 [Streptomyces virginiae]|uniref:Uncharacterized protein n=1 Tax=Streptomyces virginiae TaxID=1961 RepID=A0A0L8MSY3_STRVG|nr:hypothetical protein ADK75_14860 [Streptomyces virginiae]
MLRTTSACGWSRNRPSIRPSVSEISSSRAIASLAGLATAAAAGFSPGTAVCWASAASTAVAATRLKLRTLRFFSRTASRFLPMPRRAPAVWYPVSSTGDAFEVL